MQQAAAAGSLVLAGHTSQSEKHQLSLELQHPLQSQPTLLNSSQVKYVPMVSQSLLPHGLVHTFGDGGGGRGGDEAAVQHPTQLHPKELVRVSQEKLTAREAQSPVPQGVEHPE